MFVRYFCHGKEGKIPFGLTCHTKELNIVMTKSLRIRDQLYLRQLLKYEVNIVFVSYLCHDNEVKISSGLTSHTKELNIVMT